MYKITEVVNDTLPSYRIDNLPEGYNEALLKKTESSMKENKDVMRKIYITKIKSKCLCPSLLTDTNLIVNRREYPIKFVAAGTIVLKSDLTLIG